MEARLIDSKHNNPPSDVEILRSTLADKNFDILERQKELITSASRAPEICEDDDTAKKITDLVKMHTSCKKALESQRTQEKEPYLTLERAVDSFFKPLTEQLDKAKNKLERVLGSWLQRKEAEERRRRQEEAKRQRDEAERLAAEAAAAEMASMPLLAEEKISEAVIVDQQAQKAEKAAEAKPAKMAAVHGDYGSRSSLRSYKVAKITDRTIIDLEALRPHFSESHIQVALNSWMAANWKDDKNPPILSGAFFSLETKAQVR